MNEHTWLVASAVFVALCISLAMTAALLMWLVSLPPDALLHLDVARSQRTAARWVRGVIGCLLIVAGLVLALPAVPGPGIAIALLGFIVADLPGKRRAEMHLLKRHDVLRAVNALRRHFHREPLEAPR